MAEQDVIESEVMMFLSDLEAAELVEVCNKIQLTFPEEARGKKNSLLKLLFTHLITLDGKEDNGFATYKIIHAHVTDIKKDLPNDPKLVNTSEVKHEVNKIEASENKHPWVEIQKLNNFKISGIIAGVSEKDKLSYTSLSYQIANGRKLGVSEDRICGAVINAISPSNNLRTYLESKPNLNLVSLVEVLHSHFKEKDSASVFTELSNAVQQSTETALDFVLRLMCLRQKMLDLSNEEGCPYDENLLGKRFFHTIFTGIRNANIRVELREKFQHNSTISDEELLKYVSEVIANEIEHNEKLCKKGTANIVENLDAHSSNSFKEKKKDNPFIKIEELKLTHEKEMAAMRAELSELRTAFQANPSSSLPQIQPDQTYIPRRRFHPRNNNFSQRRKCSACEKNNTQRCFHCFTCGSAEHFMFACPQKNM